MGTAAAASMDPNAPLPEGDVLILETMEPSAPLRSAEGRRILAEFDEAPPAVKPLRPPKEPHPVADEVDYQQVHSPDTAVLEAVAPQAPVAPPSPPAGWRSFAGGLDNNTSIPPDTTGAVGPAHVVSPHNNDVWMYDRNGTQLLHMTLDAFWAAIGLAGNTFDPRIVYDAAADRFIFVTMADAGEPTSSLLVAVTTSGDPTAGWVGAAIQVDDQAQGPVWLDYPCLGFTADKITISVNLYTRSQNSFRGATLYAIDKQSLYNSPHQPSLQRFLLIQQGGTHAPAVTCDQGVTDQYVVARWSPNSGGDGYLLLYRIVGLPGPAGGATIQKLGFIAAGGFTWSPFPPGDFAPQSGSTRRIDVGDDRILGVVLRANVLYCSHTVMLPTGAPTRSAVQWWEIDLATNSVRLLGRVEDLEDKQFYAYPTLAVNQRGDLLIGFSQFSGAIFGSASFVLRRQGQAALPPQIFAPGADTYFKTFDGADNRWGDYSATQVDPDDHDFWTVQEYVAAQDTWGTMWVHLQP